jgi:hypothetical protein
VFIIIKVIFKKPIVEKRLLQKMKTPTPFKLPPAVCPGAPIKPIFDPDYIPIGNSVRCCLFSMDECPGALIKKRLSRTFNGPEPCNLFSSGDDGYETPDDQNTVPWNAPPVRKKKR